jgi:predicted TIM-barrel fold metal-dependent hydrolase
MIIDFHAHCFPDGLAKRAIARLESTAKIKASFDGTIKGLQSSMKEAGIKISVIQSIATKPAQTETINNWSAAVESNEHIIAFGTIHPDYINWKKEIRRIKDLGLRGIKYHPDYQDFFVDEKRMFPVYEEIFKLGLIVLFHAGVDIGLPGADHCTPRRLSNILKQFPGGRIVAAHMGGFWYWKDVSNYLLGKEIYFDTSYSIKWMGDKLAKKIILDHGYKKILFATDSPWASQKDEVDIFRNLRLGEDIEKAIFAENAIRLLSN